MKNLRKALLTVVGTATLLIGTTTFANVTGTVTLPDGTKPETTYVDISKYEMLRADGTGPTIGSILVTKDSDINMDMANTNPILNMWKSEAQPNFKDHWLLKVKAEKDGIEYVSEIKTVDGKPFNAKLNKVYPVEFYVRDTHGNVISNSRVRGLNDAVWIGTNSDTVEDHTSIYGKQYKPGNYKFTLKADGFKDKEVTVTVNNYRTKVNVVMEAVNPVTVTGKMTLEDGTAVTNSMIERKVANNERFRLHNINLNEKGEFKIQMQSGTSFEVATATTPVLLTDGIYYQDASGNNKVTSNTTMDKVLKPFHSQIFNITTKDGKALEASVKVTVDGKAYTLTKATTENNYYLTSLLSAGTHKVKVEAEGYKPVETEIKVSAIDKQGTTLDTYEIKLEK